MGLYDYIDFLSFEDLADYLTDKDVYNFDVVGNSFDRQKLQDWIVSLFQHKKLHPVFYYDGIVKENFEVDSRTLPFEGYIFVNNTLFNNLLPDKIVSLNCKEFLQVCKHTSEPTYTHDFDYIFMDTERYKNGYRNPMERIEKILSDIEDRGGATVTKELEANPNTLKNDIFIHFYDLFYLKSELDNMFNNKTDNQEYQIYEAENKELNNELKKAKIEQADNEHLTTQLDQANARIAELEQQLSEVKQDKPTTAIDEVTKIILNYDEVQAVKDIYSKFWISNKEKNRLQHTVIQWVIAEYPSINESMAKFLDKIVRQKHTKK